MLSSQTASQLPLISVIVPAYNMELFLDKCMETICEQTYTNLEIIIVDDGSIDHTSALCQKWAKSDRRIKVVHQHNQGLSAARNTALDIATGQWIAFADSDDWIEPRMYEDMLHLALVHDADIVACGHIREKRSKQKIYRPTHQESEIITPNLALRMLVIDNKLQNHIWSKIYKRHLFDNVRFPVGAIYEDIAISHLLFHQAHKVVLTKHAYYHYRIRTGSLSREARINAAKELQYFHHITHQTDFVITHTHWHQASYYLHRRAVGCIGHLLLLPPSEAIDQGVSQIVATMRRHPFYYTVQFSPIIFIKRLWLLHSLSTYRYAYRFIEHFRGKPRF